MNAKFIRDEYGLRCELTGQTDTERVLLAELMGLCYGKRAKRGLQIMSDVKNEKITLARPLVFLNHEILVRDFGFSCIIKVKTYWLQRDGISWLLRGSGMMTLYRFEGLPLIDNFIFGYGYFDYKNSENETKRVDFSTATRIVRNLQTPQALKNAMM